jgi:hypothetical protein
MEFEQDAQKQTYEKVLGYMRELFGEMASVHPDRPAFIVPEGSTLTHVWIAPWGTDEAVVIVRSYVVYQAELAPELYEFLVRQNDNMRFGAFGVDKDGDIFFQHSIVGSTCDKGELRASVRAVCSTADDYDEQIQQRWGGMREYDRWRKMQGS